MSKAAELANLIGNINAGGGSGQNKNYIINSAMRLAQRGTSTTGLKNTGAVYTVDRFSYRRNGTWTNFDAKHEQVTITDTLPVSKGLHNALKVTCTTAEGSVPSGTECTGIGYYTELQDLYRFGVGTANMKTMTISFYVKASIATTYGFSIQAPIHSDHQAIDIPFTVSSANTYERISITLPTYNVALNTTTDNDVGWRLFWGLDGVASSRTASAWNNLGSDGFLMPNGVSATGFSNTLNATFEITGVQLEVGDVATEFEHEPVERTLAKCQRYYNRTLDDVAYNQIGGSFMRGNSDKTKGVIEYPVEMRAKPSVSVIGTNAGAFAVQQGDTGLSGTISFGSQWSTGSDKRSSWLDFTGATSGTQGYACQLYRNNRSVGDGSGCLQFDSEL